MAEGALLLAALVIGPLLGVQPFARFELTASSLLLGLLATIPPVAGLRWSLRTPWPPIARLVDFVKDRLGPLFIGCSVGQLVLLALLAGVAEEALFRGVVQLGTDRWLPPGGGLIAASLLFGLVHFLTFSYAILATLVGLYLGSLLLLSGNLLVPIVVHALYDLIALMALSRPDPDRAGA